MAAPLRRGLIAIFVAVLSSRTGLIGAGERCANYPEVPPQIRASSCQVGEAIATGMAHSATFRRLVDRIGELKGIVYVSGKHIVLPEARRILYGTLQHRVVQAGDFRLLYVTVAPGREDTHVALLAHEFQHAIEVLESPETTEAGLQRLFARIGTEAGARTFETAEAERTQQAVLRELAASHR